MSGEVVHREFSNLSVSELFKLLKGKVEIKSAGMVEVVVLSIIVVSLTAKKLEKRVLRKAPVEVVK